MLIFFLQSASAAFTPTFQATIPDVLPEEARYTRALSLSRLAYDLENIVSPTLAAVLLAVVSYNTLFLGTVAGFLASALFVLSVLLPSPKPEVSSSIYDRTTRGMHIYLATPRLRGLLASHDLRCELRKIFCLLRAPKARPAEGAEGAPEASKNLLQDQPHLTIHDNDARGAVTMPR